MAKPFITGRPFYTGKDSYKNSSNPKVRAMSAKQYDEATSHPFNPLAQNSQFEAPKGANPKVLGSYKNGGKVPKTGIYKLHKDEVVIPKGRKRMAKNTTPGQIFQDKTGMKGQWQAHKTI